MAAARRKQNGDFDAQLAAREAARREGKTLGEWLHDAIADRAAELGVSESEIVGRERADAVFARLERTRSNVQRRSVAGRAARSGASPAGASLSERGSARREQGGEAPAHHFAAHEDEADDHYDDFDTAASVGRSRPERRAGEALASFAELLERNEARRLRERESVAALTSKLASIESKLVARFDPDDHPIKSALARLEARLDSIGRRDAAELAVRESAAAIDHSPAAAGSVQRFEEKLDTILQAVGVGPVRHGTETSVAALAEAQKAPAGQRRSLGEAIADISRRQKTLDGEAGLGRRRPVEVAAAEPVSVPRTSATPYAPAAPSATAASPDVDIAALAARVDALRFDVMVGRRGRSERRDTALASVRDELDSLADSAERSRSSTPFPAERDRQAGETVAPSREAPPIAAILGEDLAVSAEASAPSRIVVPASSGPESGSCAEPPEALQIISDAARSAPICEGLALARLETQLETLAAKVENILAAKPSTLAASAQGLGAIAVEDLLRDLGERIEAVQAPQAGAGAFDDLQRKVEQLAHRFERSEQGIATLPALAESVSEIFHQLEATQASVDEKAAEAARVAVRSALQDARLPGDAAPSSDGVASLQAMQDEADARTRATLGTVHDMLEKVVNRLSQMEEAISDLRNGRTGSLSVLAAREAVRPEAGVAAVGNPKSAGALDLTFGVGATDGGSPAVRRSDQGRADQRVAAAPETRKGKADPQPETAQHADFIAAARRAAQTAQAESAAASVRRPALHAEPEQDARAGLLAKSRAFVASHKRPLLVGVAAIVMVLGAISVLQRTGLSGLQDLAGGDAQPRSRFAAAEPPSAVPAARPTARDLPPSALGPNGSASPKASQPAVKADSDPVQTGSTPSLPAFAAQAGLTSPPPAGLPRGLRTAAEAGDSAAAYALALQYTDGRSLPRDLKAAAHWFEKAAAAGLAPAQYRLASLYEKGLGVTQDKAKARSLYTQAAEAGNPRAMHNLGVMLADGDGHPDYAGAARWFEKAAEFGVHDSQYNLAILLARGLGVPQSLAQSYRWFAVAALHDDTDAAQKRDEVGAKLNANELAVAKALAASYKAKPVNNAAVEIAPPPGGWDSVATPSHLNSAKAKVSLL